MVIFKNTNMVKINEQPKEIYLLFNSEKIPVGEISNYWQWLDIRLQIKHNSLSGYYIMDSIGTKARIDRWGNYEWELLDPYSNVPNLLYDLID